MTMIDNSRPRRPSRAVHHPCLKPVGYYDLALRQFGLSGPLEPAERIALRAICERGDLLEVDGHTYLLAPLDALTLDALAVFESEGEDVLQTTDEDDDTLQDCEPTEDDPPPTLWGAGSTRMFLATKALDPKGRPGVWSPIDGRRA